MTEELPNPYASPGEPLPSPHTYYGEAGTVSTATIIAWGLAIALGGMILLCSGIGLAAFVGDYRNPSDFPGLITGTCSLFVLLPAGLSLFLVLIEFRRRLFLILMGIGILAAVILFILGGIAHG